MCAPRPAAGGPADRAARRRGAARSAPDPAGRLPEDRCGVDRRAALRLLPATPPAWARRRAADPQQQVDGPEAGERDYAVTVALACFANTDPEGGREKIA